MFAALYAYASALLVFALVAEAHSPWLEWAGAIYAFWLAVAGSIVGYRAARQD